MRLLIFFLVLGFVALPYEAQIAVIALVRPLWLSSNGQALMFGAIGASVAAMGWYSLGWNALADSIYQDDIRKAEQGRTQRRRGR